MKFDRTQIKLFALFTMTLNHFAEVFLSEGTLVYTILCDVGYFTAITMLYFLVEGYGYTKDNKKYATRLFVFAVISQIPFHLCFNTDYKLNMLFTIFLCFILCEVHFLNINGIWKSLATIVIVVLCTGCDWFFFAPVFTLLFITAKKEIITFQSAFSLSIGFYFVMVMFIELNSGSFPTAFLYSIGEIAGPVLAAVILLLFYNGEKGDYSPLISKWMFYVYYPLHLLVMWGVKCILR